MTLSQLTRSCERYPLRGGKTLDQAIEVLVKGTPRQQEIRRRLNKVRRDTDRHPKPFLDRLVRR